MDGTFNKTGADTLKEIMSEDISLSEVDFQNLTNIAAVVVSEQQFENLSKHTVFYLVHKYMQTINKKTIDQLIRFDEPIELKNSLLEIQRHHQKILKFIQDFDLRIQANRRQVADDLPKIERERARRREYLERRARRFAEGEERAEKRKSLPGKRRSIETKKLNIHSTSGRSYQ